MEKILEKLWYGEIDPSAREFKRGSEYHELLHLLNKNQDKLLATLDVNEKELFEKFKDCQNEMQTIETREVFIEGFRLGVKIMAESLTDGNGKTTLD